MFRDTRLRINGGTFTHVTGDFHSYSIQPSNEALKREGRDLQLSRAAANINNYCFFYPAMKKLFEYMAPGAIHDSADRRDAPKCHPRTREAVIHDVLKWAWNSSSIRLLMWIYGPAGAGKSAIMQTIAEICQETGTLGASFFFLRGADRRNIADHLVATLAYQLARRVPHFCDYLAATTYLCYTVQYNMYHRTATL